MELKKANEIINAAVSRKEMGLIVATCSVIYRGRAASNLEKAKRLILIKADNSISIHQNRLVRPVNYMVNTKISTEIKNKNIELIASKTKPKEKLIVTISKVESAQNFKMNDNPDIRLSGSELELSKQLAEDLSMIEKGLIPVNKELPFRKGVVDILAKDKKGNLVVIEVKRRKASHNAVTQLKRYMSEVENIKGKKARGILLAPDIIKSAREMLEKDGLEYCRLDFEMAGNKAKILGLKKKQSILEDY